MAFLLDAHDRELIAWQAVANAGISGSDAHGMRLEAVDIRFGSYYAPEVIEILSRQRKRLHSNENPHSYSPTRPDVMLHASFKPAIQWYVRSLRSSAIARASFHYPTPKPI